MLRAVFCIESGRLEEAATISGSASSDAPIVSRTVWRRMLTIFWGSSPGLWPPSLEFPPSEAINSGRRPRPLCGGR